jgi:hypothetical protein
MPEGVNDSMSNPMSSSTESVLTLFLMSMTNFGDCYCAFEWKEYEFEEKVSSDAYVQLAIRFYWTHNEACMLFILL